MKFWKLSLSMLVFLVILLIGFSLTPTSVRAGSVNWSGNLGAGDPTWQRPTCHNVTDNVEWYDVQGFWVTQTGTYTITIANLTGNLDDPYYLLYQYSFSPTSPNANCVADDDDSGPYSDWASELNVTLIQGRQYFLVTTQCCDGTDVGGDDGGYTNQIIGPGSINLGTDAPPPTNTPTVTNTPTATNTPTVTNTPDPTITPSLTPYPSATSTPTVYFIPVYPPDDRINWGYGDLGVVLYRNRDELAQPAIVAYCYDGRNTWFGMQVSENNMENGMRANGCDATFYILKQGTYQFNIHFDGKRYEVECENFKCRDPQFRIYDPNQ